MKEEINCIVNKRFLFFKWKEVIHDYKIFSINKFMYYSTDFIVTYKCDKCGACETLHFVNQDTLILEGISIEILNNIGTDKYYIG